MREVRARPLQVFVDRLASHSPLSQEECEAVLSLPSTAMKVPARRDLGFTGNTSHSAHFIVSGLVARYSLTRNGARQLTAFHIPGDVADLYSLVRPGGVAPLHAITETTALCIPHEAIRRVAAAYPAVAEAFWRHCAIDAATVMKWLVNISQLPAAERMAHLICEMAARLGTEGLPAISFDFAVTQEQLGDALGLTAVHTNRVLKALRNEGLATMRGGKVEIHNWTTLAAYAGFNDTYLALETHNSSSPHANDLANAIR